MKKIIGRVEHDPTQCCLSSLSEFDTAVEESLDPEK